MGYSTKGYLFFSKKKAHYLFEYSFSKKEVVLKQTITEPEEDLLEQWLFG